ncbi:hypothetical protein [Mycobacterium intracellulare]|uniref:Uncharacterized protein n=1 Tax=Mycobacterium intracellulare subsp. chimaera TaxID=222805 RepID=A0ABT7P7X8_MYCIT|nr:hypothetical protein [Mycobacterium intracellulare]ASL09443.1 hypothetical protein MYCODSM44623_02718 [Mycobacterium intracellulare subsp. chimaera]ASL21247.1 hypothetical protein MYCOZU1_02830 [Mycobacterium intracellulare subsp. chimaera]MCF1814439.1 hypothetical protein [Mycobacterium intracellulare subsp. intracellulare]MDM3929391.1 hypothetical protein [Mycobacterium intracellulare subsp. chimaera]MDM3935474.1 hypothetical protein [Mycobacterium intracellulare subsp. chimaera]
MGMLGVGEIGIDGIGDMEGMFGMEGMFSIGIFMPFMSFIIFSMSAFMDSQQLLQSAFMEPPQPGCAMSKYRPATMTKIPAAIPVTAKAR